MIHETEIRYAITSDGVRIAYRTFGQGLPVVLLHPHAMTHLEREWDIPLLRSWYERLGEHVQVVRMSHRGFGLSEGDASFVTLDDFVRDLEAVIGALGATQVGFVASGIGTPAAVAYASRYPERVARMVLFAPFLGYAGADLADAVGRSLAVARLGMTVWARRVATWVDPGGVADERALLTLVTESVSAETHADWAEAIRRMGVADAVRTVRAPTLVLMRREEIADSPPQTRGPLALADVREIMVEGSAVVPYFEGGEENLALIRNFLLES